MSDRGILLRDGRSVRHVVTPPDVPVLEIEVDDLQPSTPTPRPTQARDYLLEPQRVWIGDLEVTHWCQNVSVRHEPVGYAQMRTIGTVTLFATNELLAHVDALVRAGGSVIIRSEVQELTMVEYHGPHVRLEFA